MYKIFSDGGSRNNPGNSACAGLLFNDDKLITYDGIFLGVASNNMAEYEGLLLGLNIALKNEAHDKYIQCYMDSQLIVNQINGTYKCKDEKLKQYLSRVIKCKERFSSISFNYIPRSQNNFADKLVNIILDASEKVAKVI